MLPAKSQPEGRRPARAPDAGPALRAGRASHLPLSTLNFSCRPFRPSISDCWSARNFSSLFCTDFGSLLSSLRSRTCCNTAAMSAGPGAAAAAGDGAETEKGEDQEDPEAWAATSATSLRGSPALARRRLPRRDPGKPSLALAGAQRRHSVRARMRAQPLEAVHPGNASSEAASDPDLHPDFRLPFPPASSLAGLWETYFFSRCFGRAQFRLVGSASSFPPAPRLSGAGRVTAVREVAPRSAC